MAFIAGSAIALGQIVLSFYGFWLVWRVLLPVLPGPGSLEDRIAPFAGYFTDPFVIPVARLTRLHPRAVTLAVLLGVAAVQNGLSQLNP